MTQPTPYRRGYDFSDAGGATPPGGPLDGELDDIGLTVSQILRNLALIQRDDTALRNGVVGIDALDSRVLGLISGGTFSIAGAWGTATAYPAGAFLTDGGAIYLVMEAHTSTSIVDDLAAGRIAKALQNDQGVRLRDDFVGNSVQTAFILSQSPARPADVEVYVDGLLVPAADYAQTGATVTFDVAPVSGAEISIFSLTWATTPPIQTLVDAVGNRNAEITASTQFAADIGDSTPGKGAAKVAIEGGGNVQGAINTLTASATRTPTGASTFAGIQAGNLTNTAVSSTAFGYDCLNDLTTGNLNSAFGTRALNRVTTGGVNSAFGAETLTALTTGSYNNAFGCKALGNTTTGWRNNAFGQWVLPLNETGQDNCAFGVNTMVQNLSGSTNNAFGNGALTTSVSAINNCAFGTNALYLGTASHNNAFGNGALYTSSTASDNNAFGYQALYSTTTGGFNSAFGQYALYANVSGTYNAAFGHRAGYAAAGDEATTVDTYCTFLGPYASRSSAVPTATVLTNSTAVGNDAKVTASNQVVLGNALVTQVRTAGDLYIGGVKVLGSRGAAVADATAAAAAPTQAEFNALVTQLNALLARCRAHGLIA